MPETSPIAAADPHNLGPADQPAGGQDAAGSGSAAGPESGGGQPVNSDMYEQVATVVKVIRPAIQADQGDIFLKGVDPETGIVSVELVGACISCPASTQTLKQGLERILKQRVDGVTEVIHVGEALAGAGEGTPVSL